MRYVIRTGEDLGAALAEFRTLRAIPQSRLAETIGVHRSYLSSLEQGEPTLAIQRLLAAFAELGVTLTAEA